MKRPFAVIIMLILYVPSLYSENSITAKMELYNLIFRTEENSWHGTGCGLISLDFLERNNRNVKSFLRIKAEPASEDYNFSISQAYVKFRLPRFRAVIGKAPFPWGEGVVFNAGDLVSGDSEIETDLMQYSITDAETWMTMVRYPLGPFSYVETVFLPPETLTETLGSSQLGGRAVTKASGIKIESGFLYGGTERSLKPYFSLQKSGFVNRHISASAAFNRDTDIYGSFKSSLAVTAGVYGLLSTGYGGSLNFRLETRLEPWGNWSEYSAGAGEPESYGIYIYPELFYSFNTNISLILKGLVSPVDRSAIIIPGFTWNIFQGFTFITLVSLNTGDADDIFAWEPETSSGSGFSVLAGITVVY